ncbi:MAG: hypothetical protein K8S98_00935 [Planctomycetes bacterium]|nr:hypothetical protein [Planctomycetota bacterium]
MVAPVAALPVIAPPVVVAPTRAPEANVRVPVETNVAVKSGVLDRLYGLAGILGVCGGVAIVATPHVAPSIAQVIARLGNPHVVGAAFALGGALLYGIGRVRRMLVALEAAVRSESARIDDVAHGGQALRKLVGESSHATGSVYGELVLVQRRLDELTKLAANPEIQTSMFHLAASQDQLAKRVDLAMQERFRALRTELVLAMESVTKTQQSVVARVEELGEHVDEQLTANQLRLQKSLETLATASVENRGRIDRALDALTQLAEELVLQRAALNDSSATTLKAVQRASQDSIAGAELLRGTLEARLEVQGQTLEVQVRDVREVLSQRLEKLDGEHGRALQELAARIEAEAAQSAQSLRDGMNSITEMVQRSRQELAVEVAAVAPRLEHVLRDATHALATEQRTTARAVAEARVDLRGEMTDLTLRVEKELEGLEAKQSSRWTELRARIETARASGDAALRQGLTALGDSTQRAHDGLVAGIDRIAPGLEQRVREETATLRDDLAAVRVGIEALGTRIDLGLERLDRELAAVRELGASKPDAEKLVRDAEESANRLRADLEALGRRIEESLRARQDALAADLTALVELAWEAPAVAHATAPANVAPTPVAATLAQPPAALPRVPTPVNPDQRFASIQLFGADIDLPTAREEFDIVHHTQNDPIAPTEPDFGFDGNVSER